MKNNKNYASITVIFHVMGYNEYFFIREMYLFDYKLLNKNTLNTVITVFAQRTICF